MADAYKRLKTGDAGEDVSRLQTALSGAGYNVTANGVYDEATANAVSRYQQDNGLDVDGIAGDQTLGALYGTTQSTQQPQGAQQNSPYTGQSATQQAAAPAGYTPGQSVTAAQDRLNQVQAQKPGAYNSQFDAQIQDIYNKIVNRQPFQYDLAGDTLYKQYRDQYMLGGQQAMMDTMGQAAALTGGYGNSYAATAGNQAYQQYLTQLNAVVPELYGQAYDRYAQEGDDMIVQYNMLDDMENQAYGRYQDQLGAWQDDYNMAANDYWNRYNADYGQYADRLQQANADREMAYNTAMTILERGQMPTADLLAQAGISEPDARALLLQTSGSSGGGGGGGSSGGSGGSGSSSGTAGVDMMPEGFDTFVEDLSTQGLNAMGDSNVLMNAANKYRAGGKDGLNSYLNQLGAQGYSEASLELAAQYAIEYVTKANKASYDYAVSSVDKGSSNAIGKGVRK